MRNANSHHRAAGGAAAPAQPNDNAYAWVNSFSPNDIFEKLSALYCQTTESRNVPEALTPILTEIARHHAFANEGKRDRAIDDKSKTAIEKLARASNAHRQEALQADPEAEHDEAESFEHETLTPLRRVMHNIATQFAKAEGPKERIEQQKINAFIEALREHPFAPALTAHPTNPRSLEIEDKLYTAQALIRLLANINNLQTKINEGTNFHPARLCQKIENAFIKLNRLKKKLGIPIGHEEEKAVLAEFQSARLKPHTDNVSQEGLDIIVRRIQQQAKAALPLAIKAFEGVPVVAREHLTVDQEVQRNLRSYTNAMRTFPTMMRQITNDFVRINGIERETYTKNKSALTAAIAAQYQEIAFWSASDADGNDRINKDTMRAALKQHQLALISTYSDLISELKYIAPSLAPQLKVIYDMLQEAATAIESDSFFTKTTSDALIEEIAQKIKEIQSPLPDTEASISITKANIHTRTENLLTTIKTFGFVGPRMDVRQTTKTLDGVLQDILSFVQQHQNPNQERSAYITHSNVKNNEQAAENIASKETALSLIQENLDAFINAYLNPSSNFNADTRTELDRFVEMVRFPDVYQRYRISDCRDVADIEAARLFETIAHKIIEREKPLSSRAMVEEEQKSPDESALPPAAGPAPDRAVPSEKHQSSLHIIPLCETPDDVERMPELVRQMVEKGLIMDDTLILFPGFSDLEKRSGLFGLITIAKALQKAIEEIQKTNPNVRVLISFGQGCDILRHGDKPVKDATIQGLPASQLTDPQIFKRWIRSTSAHEDDYLGWLEELSKLSEEEATLLSKIEHAGRDNFRQMVSHTNGNGDATHELIKATTVSEAIGKANRSSRKAAKEAKKAANEDAAPATEKPEGKKVEAPLDNIRAIGFSLHFSASGTQTHLFEGIPSLEKLTKEEIAQLPSLFEKSTIVQDIVYKGLYGAAMTDYPRAWKMLGVEEVPTTIPKLRDIAATEGDSPQSTLACLQLSAYEKLESLVAFLPIPQAQKEGFQIFIKEDIENSASLNTIALTLLKGLESEPALKQETPAIAMRAGNLAEAAEHIQNNIHPRIRGLIDQYRTETLAQEPSEERLASITDALTMAFKEEQHVPHAITHHTNDCRKEVQDKGLVQRLSQNAGGVAMG